MQRLAFQIFFVVAIHDISVMYTCSRSTALPDPPREISVDPTACDRHTRVHGTRTVTTLSSFETAPLRPPLATESENGTDHCAVSALDSTTLTEL